MLNVNWPQLRKTHADLETDYKFKDDDEVMFHCVVKNVKNGNKSVVQKRVKFSDFLRTFSDLCDLPSQVTRVVVSTLVGQIIYRHHSVHLEQMPIGGSPSILENWAKLEDLQKEMWLKITIAQFESQVEPDTRNA